eukprot:TRINITY_DN7603_c0_g1_i1.p1 TRINITY_DN7603_c0_g1~~TRINITY_DN7603_c0_g1_i1.p1  ORF type:complete len:214 (+),score=48.98 TRINITY_DN7603_c0_g1_i1:37-642(+)
MKPTNFALLFCLVVFFFVDDSTQDWSYKLKIGYRFLGRQSIAGISYEVGEFKISFSPSESVDRWKFEFNFGNMTGIGSTTDNCVVTLVRSQVVITNNSNSGSIGANKEVLVAFNATTRGSVSSLPAKANLTTASGGVERQVTAEFTPETGGSGSDELSAGAIAGIVIGVIVGCVVLVLIILFILKKTQDDGKGAPRDALYS